MPVPYIEEVSEETAIPKDWFAISCSASGGVRIFIPESMRKMEAVPKFWVVLTEVAIRLTDNPAWTDEMASAYSRRTKS